jgi:hypothetical protein
MLQQLKKINDWLDWVALLPNFIIQHWISWELSFIICFDLLSMGIYGLMIKVAIFSILTSIKLGLFFLILSLKGYLGLMTRVMVPSKLDFFFIGLSPSHNLGRELTQLTQFF